MNETGGIFVLLGKRSTCLFSEGTQKGKERAPSSRNAPRQEENDKAKDYRSSSSNFLH